MTKQDIITEVAQEAKCGEFTAREVVDSMLMVMTRALQNHEEITFRGFGSFKIVQRASKLARNIKTGEGIWIPAHPEVSFEPGKELKNI